MHLAHDLLTTIVLIALTTVLPDGFFVASSAAAIDALFTCWRQAVP